jgi:hypothetical protein
VAQAERIGQIWNPATAGDLVLPEMLEAHNQLNIAAARQQEALELRAATLANPEPGIAARADAAGREANAIIVNALPNTLSTCTRLLTEMVQGGQR